MEVVVLVCFFQKPTPSPNSIFFRILWSVSQQQCLFLARAPLFIEPEVTLMDEPTSALDPISTAKVEELIDSLHQKITLVVVTHNLQQATRISKQVVFF